MSRILKSYGLKDEVLQHHLESIAQQFSGNRKFLKYELDHNSYLILTTDERKLCNFRKYRNSPFPLLSNLELFSNTVGQWNQDLLSFGIKTREKYHDNPETKRLNLGTKIHLVLFQSPNQKGNKYLRTQYSRLEKLRRTGDTKQYWEVSWTLMRKSWTFRIASLNSWLPRWYKVLSPYELKQIWKILHRILSFDELQTTIKNVWIESPKGKYRQLGVPNKGWRLYLHMVNFFISYIYDPLLSKEEHDGFIFNRGCKSWWESLLWGNWLTRYSSLLEVDLTSAFPNLSRVFVKKALLSDGLIPPLYVNLIMSHLASPLKSSQWFPTFETFVENSENQSWRKSNRSVHMGLGISPILYVITLDWVLRRLSLKNENFCYKWYADDGSFYFNLIGMWNVIRTCKPNWLKLLFKWSKGRSNIILTLLNEHPLLKSSGIKFCLQKSSLVRILGVWLKPYSSLGLRLKPSLGFWGQVESLLKQQLPQLELQGFTRGRGANPKKGKAGTSPSRTKLSDLSKTAKPLTLSLLLNNYKPYFGLIMAYLYSPSDDRISYKYKIPPLKPKSILWKLIRKLPWRSRKNQPRLDIYNAGCKLTEVLLRINTGQILDYEWAKLNPNLYRELRFPWKSCDKGIDQISFPRWDEVCPCPKGEDSFRKFSELELSEAKLKKYRELFSLQTPPTGMPNKPN